MVRTVNGVDIEVTDENKVILSAPWMVYELTLEPEKALGIAAELATMALYAIHRREAKSGVQSWTLTR